MKASIIIPVFNEEANVETVYGEVKKTFGKLGVPFEFIFIDDGSRDLTFVKISGLNKSDGRVNCIRFSKNFGYHAAASAGIAHASGDFAIFLSADLQEPIKDMGRFISKWKEGYEVVWAMRRSRKDPFLTKLASKLFYWILRTNRDFSFYPKDASFVLIDKKVIKTLQGFPERNRMIWGLVAWSGFAQTEIECDFLKRRHGRSKWSLAKKIKMAIDIYTAFSYKPIKLAIVVGLVLALLSFTYGFLIIVGYFLGYVASIQGWPTIMVTILFVSGVQLLVSGIIGEYIWRTLDEVRGRPLYIISETLGISVPKKSR